MRILITLPIVLAVAAGVVAQTSRPTAESAPSSRPVAKDFRFVVPGSTWELKMVAVPAASFGGKEFWCASTEIPWDAYDPFVYLLDVGEGEKDLDGVTRPSKPYVPPDRGLGHAGYPVISVSHRGASAFAAWLSLRTGGTFRLPSEGEFETLALAGAQGSLCVPMESIGDYAWTGLNSAGVPQPVGTTKRPNAWGLFDLHGNVQEWCDTPDTKGVTKGGNYTDHPKNTAVDKRRPYLKSWQSTDPNIPKSTWWLSDAPMVGFRVVCTSIPTKVTILRDSGAVK